MTMTDRANLARQTIGMVAAHLRHAGGEGTAEVLSRLDEQDLDGDSAKPVEAARKPVTRVLPEVLQDTARNWPGLADALARLSPHLTWSQSSSYTDEILGEGFGDNYAWAELVGPSGYFAGDDFTLGFLLLGPGRHYIDHYHPAPELYLPLTSGSHWKKGEHDFVERKPGEVIWHPSMVIHATKTFTTPLLAAYCWTRDVATPAKLRV